MDMKQAQDLVASAPPSISDHRLALAERYAGEPQRAAGVDLAMKQIEDALHLLAQHGHRYVLVEQDEAPVGDKFPMMLYRSAGETRVVEGEIELSAAKKAGWRIEQFATPTPAPASSTKKPNENDL